MGVVLAVVLALAGAGAAQAAWSGSDALATGRYDHTATLLQDGRVLVTGGNDTNQLASAQLYDPATSGWSSAAPMNTARNGHAAALLKSGKVLVAGGSVPTVDPITPASDYTRTAEVYDPAANTWTKVADMGTARYQPTMTVLKDGRVLVAGGSGTIAAADGIRAAVSLASAEIYDPSNNSWSDVPPMSVARSMDTATLLDSGKVLVAGGYDDATGELNSAELYDPSSNDWSPTGPLDAARDSATATTLQSGEVLVAGGDSGSGALDTVEVYNPESGAWHAAASMAGARQSAAAVLLKDGSVLVAGGRDARLGNLLDTTERYDAEANSWTSAGTMALARAQHTLTALDDGRAIVVGGSLGGFAGGLNAVERFSAVTTNLTPANFGSRPIGSASDVVTSVLTNTGKAPLDVSGVSIAGGGAKDFAIVSDSCHASTVAAGDECRIDLRFTPSVAGARSATLTVADNTAGGTTIATLTGTGLAPASAGDGTPPAGGGATGATGPTSGPTSGPASGPAKTPGSGTLSERAHSSAPHASCTVKTKSGHGGGRSTVTCRMTWPTSKAVALRARLMQGTKVLASARTTARGGHATLSLRPAQRLRSGRYAVVIARPNGTVVLRSAIRVS